TRTQTKVSHSQSPGIVVRTRLVAALLVCPMLLVVAEECRPIDSAFAHCEALVCPSDPPIAFLNFCSTDQRRFRTVLSERFVISTMVGWCPLPLIESPQKWRKSTISSSASVRLARADLMSIAFVTSSRSSEVSLLSSSSTSPERIARYFLHTSILMHLRACS